MRQRKIKEEFALLRGRRPKITLNTDFVFRGDEYLLEDFEVPEMFIDVDYTSLVFDEIEIIEVEEVEEYEDVSTMYVARSRQSKNKN